jgi:putative transcriptional regulator
MQRLRLKADGRIVELRDGQEFPLAPAAPAAAPATTSVAPGTTSVAPGMAMVPAVRDLRRRARLRQIEVPTRIGALSGRTRNWKRGRGLPR